MALQLDDLVSLDALDAPEFSRAGVPLMLQIDAIDEDPEQPRREFDANALEELAQTIRERGVRQPISVRPNLRVSERWTLNFGARRLRAARLAGLAQVPAFIDTTADSYDQVIENEQREGLKPMEIALFVQKRLALGDSKSEIARRLGKSKQWLTLATALIDAPEWLLDAYRAGRCNGMNELYELRRLHGAHSAEVEAWAAESGVMTRERIVAFRNELRGGETASVAQSGDAAGAMSTFDAGTADARPASPGLVTACGATSNPPTLVSQRIHVEYEGQDYQLVVSVAPPEAGAMYIRPMAGGPRRQAPASALLLRGFVGS